MIYTLGLPGHVEKFKRYSVELAKERKEKGSNKRDLLHYLVSLFSSASREHVVDI